MSSGSRPTSEHVRNLETSLQGVDLDAAVREIQANPALASRIADLARRLPGGLAAGNFNCVCGAARQPGAEVVQPNR